MAFKLRKHFKTKYYDNMKCDCIINVCSQLAEVIPLKRKKENIHG